MKPMHSYVALKYVYVKQRSSQAMACLFSEMLVSPYVIKTMINVLNFLFSECLQANHHFFKYSTFKMLNNCVGILFFLGFFYFIC